MTEWEGQDSARHYSEGYQDAEKDHQRRSHIAQRLYVPKRTPPPFRSLRPCCTAFLSILSYSGFSTFM